MENNNYKLFLIMLIVSFFVMYAVMFLNVDKLDHIYLSITRLYMTLLMVSPMAISMLLLMPKMYQNTKVNVYIITFAIVVFVLSLVLLRTQVPIGDNQYIKAMIPHHSSAILVSQEANLKDPELKELANEIIEAQVREIEQMEKILEGLNN